MPSPLGRPGASIPVTTATPAATTPVAGGAGGAVAGQLTSVLLQALQNAATNSVPNTGNVFNDAQSIVGSKGGSEDLQRALGADSFDDQLLQRGIENFEQIRGSLSPAEAQRVESALATKISLQSSVKFMKTVLDGIINSLKRGQQ